MFSFLDQIRSFLGSPGVKVHAPVFIRRELPWARICCELVPYVALGRVKVKCYREQSCVNQPRKGDHAKCSHYALMIHPVHRIYLLAHLWSVVLYLEHWLILFPVD